MRNNSYEGSRYTTDVEDFKAGRKTVLVCTNALARGLDVQAASVVMNFELCDPQRCVDMYIRHELPQNTWRTCMQEPYVLFNVRGQRTLKSRARRG